MPPCLPTDGHGLRRRFLFVRYIPVDGTHVLLFSPVGMQADGYRYRNVFQTGYLLGDFDYDSAKLTHAGFEEIDRGHDFYASQTFETPDGRRVCIGWMNMWQTPMPEQRDGWAGALTLPRELHVVDGKVSMTPIRELTSLRADVLVERTDAFTDHETLVTLTKNQAEVLFSCADLNESGSVGLSFDVGAGKSVDFGYDRANGLLTLDRGGADGVRAYACGALERLDLRVYVDNSSLEVFVNEGLATFTSRIYPTAPIRVESAPPPGR